MIDNKQIQKNIAKWSATNPKAGVFLSYLDDSHLVFGTNSNGEANLQVNKDGKFHSFHSSQNAAKEAEDWFNALDLKDIETVCIYGVGLGYAYTAAKKWLKKKRIRRLVFIEDDLAVICYLLATEQGTQIINDSQVQLMYLEEQDLSDPFSTLTELYWQIMTAKIVVTALPLYRKIHVERLEQLQHKIVYDASVRESVLSEYLEYGAVFYGNLYPNILKLPESYLGNNFFGKFKDVPAIICGAGPSLKKHLPILESLKDKALIFAGGSSLNVLNSAGLQPHLGAGIDPNPMQFERLKASSAEGVPFLYRSRMHRKAFNAIRGPRLYVMGSGGYETAKWFEENLELEGEYIEEGFNVVNFCMELAHVFGCNPIIFIGVDLAYTNMEFYAPGVIEENAASKEHILDRSKADRQGFLKPDIYGNPVYTLWKWIAEAQWIGNFAKEHPEIKVINATEGGIGFPNVPNVPLDEVIKNELKQTHDLKSTITKELSHAKMPQVTTEKVEDLMKELRDSLIKCRESLSFLKQDTEGLIEQVQQDKFMPLNYQSGQAALCEIELAEEPGYKYVLDIFNSMYSCFLSRELHQLKIRPNKPIPWRKGLKKLKITQKKLTFLLNVTNVNISIIDHTLNKIDF